MKGIGRFLAILGSIGFIISIFLRGTKDYSYGQYPWMQQASFASAVDTFFYLSIGAVVLGIALIVIETLKDRDKAPTQPNSPTHQNSLEISEIKDEQQEITMNMNANEMKENKQNAIDLQDSQFCVKCGSKLNREDVYCWNCGNKIK